MITYFSYYENHQIKNELVFKDNLLSKNVIKLMKDLILTPSFQTLTKIKINSWLEMSLQGILERESTNILQQQPLTTRAKKTKFKNSRTSAYSLDKKKFDEENNLQYSSLKYSNLPERKKSNQISNLKVENDLKSHTKEKSIFRKVNPSKSNNNENDLQVSIRSLVKTKQSKAEITFKVEEIEVKHCLTPRNQIFQNNNLMRKERKTHRQVLPTQIQLNTVETENTPHEMIFIEDESTQETYYKNTFMKHTMYVESLNTLENVAKQKKERNLIQDKKDEKKGVIDSLIDFLNPFKCGN